MRSRGRAQGQKGSQIWVREPYFFCARFGKICSLVFSAFVFYFSSFYLGILIENSLTSGNYLEHQILVCKIVLSPWNRLLLSLSLICFGSLWIAYPCLEKNREKLIDRLQHNEKIDFRAVWKCAHIVDPNYAAEF